MKMTTQAERLFEKIRTIERSIDSDAQERIVATIIEVFKRHKLSYHQCYDLLGATEIALRAMSEAVHL